LYIRNTNIHKENNLNTNGTTELSFNLIAPAVLQIYLKKMIFRPFIQSG